MQAEALTVTPLRAMASNPEKVKKLRTRNARRAQASPSGKTAIPSSSSPGTRSVHVAIARIVSDILNENKSVSGITVPLNHQSASPSLAVDPDVNENVKTSGDDVDSPVKVDVYPSASVPEGCLDDNVMESPADNMNEIPDEILEKSPDQCTPDNSPVVSADNISDSILEETPEKNTNQNMVSHIINLDEEFSDNDLIAKVNPSISRRVMNRKGKKSAAESSVHEKKAEVGCKTPRAERKAVEKSGKSNKAGTSKGKGKVKNVGDSPKAKSTSIVRKRKAPEPSDQDDSDFDVTENVSEIHSKRRLSPGKMPIVPEVPIDNISFHHPENAKRWKYVSLKRIALERELHKDALECKEVIDLIKEAGLMRTVVKFSNCYEGLVKEFIVNLSNGCADGRSADFKTVFVRGRKVEFSSSVINKYLGRSDEAQSELEETDNQVCQAITAKQVKHWPLKGKLSASKLSVKFAILHKIGAANWVPTNHKSTISIGLGRFIFAVGTKAKFDYGSYIFYQILKHADSYAIKGPIAFPSLLCGIITDQYPDILVDRDLVCKRATALGFHYKLFQGKHVPDIVMTSAETSNVKANSQKANVIAVLKETCRELEARKQTIEELISTLEQEKEDTEVEDERLHEDAEEDQQDGAESSSTEEDTYHSASSGEDSA